MNNLIEEAIREYFGERCPDFDPGCLGCLAWKAVDELASLRSDNERLRAALEKINVGEGWAALIARAALEGE